MAFNLLDTSNNVIICEVTLVIYMFTLVILLFKYLECIENV